MTANHATMVPSAHLSTKATLLLVTVQVLASLAACVVSITLYCVLLHKKKNCTALHYTVFYPTVLFCAVLECAVLCCAVNYSRGPVIY